MDYSEISVLIVEDVPEMLGLLEEVLSKTPGFRVSGLAKNGFEARLELLKRRPDLVLLDEVLPGEAGLDVLKDITQDGPPVILITGMEEVSDKIPPGALGRISKPSWESLEKDRVRIRASILRLLGRGP
ncbi:MAG: response regulator [Bdellovibrio sp.]|nr:response regulator [Bdellovibrio sp.]